MAEKFDPYHVWLSISPEEQPPTLYRLLGLRPFEDNLDVIENAADRQMTHLRTYQAGKHSAESQKLLNQIASAKLNLLKPEKKAEYDKLLREQMNLEAESVLDDESSVRQEELSMTLVGFLEAIQAEKEQKAEGKPGHFDPYEEWLAIAPEEQPPTLYRLLGLRPLEDNRNTIKDAAKRRTAHLREFVSDEHGDEARKLLTQVSSARLTLLNRNKKADYDRLLRQRTKLEDEGSQPDEELSTTLAGFLAAVDVEKAKPAEPRKPPKQSEAATPADKAAGERRFMIGAAVGVGILLLLVIAVLAVKFGGGKQEEKPKEDNWLADIGQQRELSRPTKPAPPQTQKPTPPPRKRSSKAPAGTDRVSSPEAPVKSGGLLAHYTFDTNASDSQGGHDGKLVGNASIVSDPDRGGVLQLDGDGDYVLLGEFGLTGDGYSVGCWFKTSATGHRTILSAARGSGGYAMLLEAKEGTLRYLHRFPFGGSSGTDIYSPGTYHDGRWHHVLAVKDPATTTLYVDGIKVGSAGNSTTFNAPVETVAGRLIGDSGPRFFAGQIDDVRVYDRALSLQEAAELANPTTARPADTVALTPDGLPVEPRTPDPESPTSESGAPTAKKLAVPPPDEQQKMGEAIEGSYKISEARSAEDRLRLAGELFAAGKKSQGEPVEKFVLLRKAMELAQSGGDAGLMMEAVDAISNEFDVNALDVKQKVLAGFASGASNLEEIKSFVEATDPVIDEAIADGRYDIAVNIAEIAYRLASGEGDAELRKRTYDRRNSVRKLALKWQGLTDARNTLKTTPDNPAANLAVGRWFCFERGDWKQGLPHLAKCSSPALKGIAAQEVNSPPATPDAQVKLADAWWNLAEKVEGKTKDSLMAHAGQWYGKALDGLPEGFAKAKVKKRLEEAGEVAEVAVEGPEEPRFDPTTAKLLWTLEDHKAEIRRVAFSPQGSILASAGFDSTIGLWDVTTGKLEKTLSAPEPRVCTVCFSPDGRTLFSGGGQETSGTGPTAVSVWSLTTGRLTRKLDGHKDAVWTVDSSPDGALLASGGPDASVKIWDIATGRAVRTFTGHTASVQSVRFSPDQSILASGGNDKKIILCELATGKLRILDAGEANITNLAFSPDGRTLASASAGGVVGLWDVRTGQARHTLKGHAGNVFGVAFSPDGSVLASGGLDKVVKLWDPATGEQLRMLAGHQGTVWCVAFCPDGSKLASASVDKTIKIWGFSKTTETSASASRVRIEDCTVTWNSKYSPARCDPGDPHCKLLKQNPYTLGFEDWTDEGYDDICLQFAQLANGDIEITVVGLNSTGQNGKFNVVAPDGKVISGLENLRREDVGTKGILKGFYKTTKPKPTPTPTTTSKLPREFSIDLPGGVKMEFVPIPAGEFMMGSSKAEFETALKEAKTKHSGLALGLIQAEVPQHDVKITRPFYLGKYEVTQQQWQAIMADNPSEFKEPDNPVERVNWNDCQEFLAKLNKKCATAGMRFTLPTEAQWEYACRAGTTTRYGFGDDEAKLGDYAWFSDNSEKKTHPVGQKIPNAWGLHDMHGNVWEWCADWFWEDYYKRSPTNDPTGPSGSICAFRGGFRGGSRCDSTVGCRSAQRYISQPVSRYGNVGFRVLYSRSSAGASSSKTPPCKVFPVGRWVPLLTSSDKLVGWGGVNEKVKYSNGVIELNDRGLSYPVVAKDMIIRAKVKKVSGSSLSLWLRDGYEGKWKGDNRFEILKAVPGKGHASLKSYTTPLSYRNGFELGFAAIGDVLTVFVNRQPIMEVRDSMFKEGKSRLSASAGTSLFRDVEIQILKK